MRKVTKAPTRKRWRQRLKKPMLLLSGGLVVVAVGAGIWRGGYIGRGYDAAGAKFETALAHQGFAVRDIRLSGEERTPADVILREMQISNGDPIFGIHPDATRARLLTLPWVQDAEIRRRFPDSVSVRVIEKRPFALWRSSGSLWVIERSGAVITAVDRAGFPNLPLLMGDGAPDAAAPLIDALSKTTAVPTRLQAIERIGERRWDLHLANGVVVRLPEEHWETQLAELEKLIVQKGVLERDIEMIDLRYPDNYVFKLHNGDSRPIPRERRA